MARVHELNPILDPVRAEIDQRFGESRISCRLNFKFKSAGKISSLSRPTLVCCCGLFARLKFPCSLSNSSPDRGRRVGPGQVQLRIRSGYAPWGCLRYHRFPNVVYPKPSGNVILPPVPFRPAFRSTLPP